MIELNAVTKRYGSLAAVDHVSFSVRTGEYFALLGPNGAGKTTIVKMLLDFTKPTSGSLSVDGRSSTQADSRSAVGFLAENHHIPPHLSGWQYLQRCAELLDVQRSDAMDQCRNIVEQIGMQGREHTKANTYSKGMIQRFGLGAALIGHPKLLILDEPTSGLDVESARLIRNVVLDLHKRGVTVFITTHNMEEANALCQRIAVIGHGHLIAVNTPERLKQAATQSQAIEISFEKRLGPDKEGEMGRLPGVHEIRALGDKYQILTSDPPAVLRALFAMVCEKDLRPVSVSTLGPSLEEVFVQLTGKKEVA